MAVEITAATAPGAAVQMQRSTEATDVSDGTVLSDRTCSISSMPERFLAPAVARPV